MLVVMTPRVASSGGVGIDVCVTVGPPRIQQHNAYGAYSCFWCMQTPTIFVLPVFSPPPLYVYLFFFAVATKQQHQRQLEEILTFPTPAFAGRVSCPTTHQRRRTTSPYRLLAGDLHPRGTAVHPFTRKFSPLEEKPSLPTNGRT